MSTATITVRTRMAIQDTGQPFIATVPADGVTLIFDLPVESISANNPLTVLLNGVPDPPSATPTWTINYKYGIIEFGSPPTAGTVITVMGTNYDYFDDDEVSQAVMDAFNLHVNDLDPLPAIDPGLGQTAINSNEEYLVSLMAAVELLWFRANDAAQTIDIHTPEGVTIPRSERYKQIVTQINALQEEYKTLAGALGVGIWRVQTLNQRRVSLTTNRLVPLYVDQNYNTPYTGFMPTTAPVGATVTINGQYFTGATSVTFGGVPSLDFTVLSDTQITAVVPPAAQTGQIGVITPFGVVLSTAQFVVGQPAPFILYGPQQVVIPTDPGL